MEIKDYLEKKKIKSGSKIFTKEQALAAEWYEFLQAKLSFPRIMVMIKKSGYEYCFQLLSEMKQEPPNNPVSLFIWKTKNNQIKWK